MKFKADEIASVLQAEIESFQSQIDVRDVGRVLEVGDGIARVYGLPDCQMGELLEFPGGVMGMALNLEEDSIGAVLIGDDSEIKEGDSVKAGDTLYAIAVKYGTTVAAIASACWTTSPRATART